jgi:hypothetical protein
VRVMAATLLPQLKWSDLLKPKVTIFLRINLGTLSGFQGQIPVL